MAGVRGCVRMCAFYGTVEKFGLFLEMPYTLSRSNQKHRSVFKRSGVFDWVMLAKKQKTTRVY